MPEYRYVGKATDGTEIRGSVDAPSEQDAREKLEQSGLLITTIEEPSRARVTSRDPRESISSLETPSFAFEATDTSGTIHRGTMTAPSKRSTFDALRKRSLRPNMIELVGVTPKYSDPDLASWLEKEGATTNSVLKEEPTGSQQSDYFSLVDTGRLYAGWLLAWYGLFIGLGYYVHGRALPWPIPFVEGFYGSTLIYQCIVALFIFLALSTLRSLLQWSSLPKDIFLVVIGITLYFLVRG